MRFTKLKLTVRSIFPYPKAHKKWPPRFVKKYRILLLRISQQPLDYSLDMSEIKKYLELFLKFV